MISCVHENNKERSYMMKTALITGVSRNIGRAICKQFVDKGYKIYGTYKSHLDDKSAMAEFVKEFPTVELFKVDFCNQVDVTNFIAKMINNRFDVIVNNAGMFNMHEGGVRNEFINFDLTAFQNVINCNLITTARLSIELKDNMNEGGNIVIIASGACLQGAYASISYNASKAALINLMESLSDNYYRYKKIRVNAVSPGWIDSEGSTMGTDKNSTFMGRVGAVTPMQRNGTPEEVAKMVYFLTTSEASFTTGSNIPVDGGYKNHNVNYLEEAGYASFSIQLIDKKD
jgi:3-oxoacyl-[acyl-carrier protein] reductase